MESRELEEALRRLQEEDAPSPERIAGKGADPKPYVPSGGRNEPRSGRHRRRKSRRSHRGRHIKARGRKRGREYRKGRGAGKRILLIVLVLFLAVLLAAGAFILYHMVRSGRRESLFLEKKDAAAAVADSLPKSGRSLDEGNVPVEGPPEEYTVSYKGKKYRYKENMVNLLFLGVDARNSESLSGDAGMNGHQADTILLAAIDPDRKEFYLLNIPRDTVTEIRVLDMNMEYARMAYGPVAIQHSYGDGGALSNRLTADAVSAILYGTPVYRYVAVNMDAIPVVNDMAGGVTVEILEDMTRWNPKMKKGAGYTLYGEDATIYVSRRDTGIEDSALLRMERQTQYLKALFRKGKEKTRKNLTFPVSVFLEVRDKLDTDLTVDEVAYLARELLDMELKEDHMITIPGSLRRIEEGEFRDYGYPLGYVADEDGLRDLVIRLFYEEVITGGTTPAVNYKN